MTTTATSPARLAAVDHLVHEVVTFMRMIHVFKAQADDRSAHGLLFPLAGLGPVRLTALAEVVHVDASTISRQVGELVREDLVRREPDPDDRRAGLLVLTDVGRRRVEELKVQRATTLAGALDDWSAEEITAFTTQFRRFTDGMTQTLGCSAAAGGTTSPTHQEAR